MGSGHNIYHYKALLISSLFRLKINVRDKAFKSYKQLYITINN